jgi:DNA-directed RNA polymerase subunit RPC12/RpoP
MVYFRIEEKFRDDMRWISHVLLIINLFNNILKCVDFFIKAETGETTDEEEELEECPFCGATVPEGTLVTHVSERHRLGCLRCRRLLATEDELEAHLQQHEDTYTCSLCELQFDDEAEYEFHRMSKHDAVKCPKCTQVLLEHEFNAHTKTCHNRKQVRSLSHIPAKIAHGTLKKNIFVTKKIQELVPKS